MRSQRRRPLLLAPALLLAASAVAVLFMFVRAQRELRRASAQTAAAGLHPFTLLPLDPESLRAANPGFEPVAAPVSWTSGAQLGEDLFLAGPSGLAQFRSGSLVHQWRTGIELPRSPISAVTVGRLRASPEPQVLLATAGDGALILSPGPQPRFQQLLPRDAELRNLTALLATGTGDLLLGTRTAGLYLFSGQSLTAAPIHLPGLDPSQLAITALAGSGTAILVGTRDSGLLYLNAGTALQIGPESLPDPRIEAIAVSSTHAYLGTPVGVAEFDLAAARLTRTLAPGLFAHTLAVQSGSLVVGTLDQGLKTIPLSRQPRLRMAALGSLDDGRQQPRIERLVPTSSGLLALVGDTVLRADSGSWAPENPAAGTASAPTLTDPNVSALALAPDGRLWVGLFDRGLDVLDPVTLTRVRHLEDDHLFCIDRLAVDPVRKTVAAATANGLVLFDASGEPRQTLLRHDGLIDDHINDLAFTPSGLALATPAGITFLNPSGPESLYAFQGLVNNHVYTLAQSPDGRELLAGTLGGLSLLRSGQVRQNLTATNSALGHNWITAALPLASPDRSSSSWLIGTYGAGLERVLLPGSGPPVITPEELPAGVPRDVVINPNALLRTPTAFYAGTLGHGLLVYSLASRRWLHFAQGLPSLNVTAFAAAGGTLYIGTENGLVRIAEARLAGASR